jgi:hypothetical protein
VQGPEDDRLLRDVRRVLDAQAEALNSEVETVRTGSRLLQLRSQRLELLEQSVADVSMVRPRCRMPAEVR